MNREFLWCSRLMAQACREKGVHHHVAVRTPGCEPVPLPCKSDRIDLAFHDTGMSSGRQYWDGLFSFADARGIADFVFSREGLFVVNCEAGISRSAGITLALRQFFGGDVFEVPMKAHPNQFVAAILFRTLLDESGRGTELEQVKCTGDKCGVVFSEDPHLLRRLRAEFGKNLLCPGCRDQVSGGVRPPSPKKKRR